MVPLIKQFKPLCNTVEHINIDDLVPESKGGQVNRFLSGAVNLTSYTDARFQLLPTLIII